MPRGAFTVLYHYSLILVQSQYKFSSEEGDITHLYTYTHINH